MSDDELSALWQQQWPDCSPLADDLKLAYRHRWVRFHSLPASQRYPETESEYDIVLNRYNTVLDERFHDREVRIITTDWSDASEPPALSAQHARWNPGAEHWTSLLTDEDETDPDYISYTHLYVSCRLWRLVVGTAGRIRRCEQRPQLPHPLLEHGQRPRPPDRVPRSPSPASSATPPATHGSAAPLRPQSTLSPVKTTDLRPVLGSDLSLPCTGVRSHPSVGGQLSRVVA